MGTRETQKGVGKEGKGGEGRSAGREAGTEQQAGSGGCLEGELRRNRGRKEPELELLGGRRPDL